MTSGTTRSCGNERGPSGKHACVRATAGRGEHHRGGRQESVSALIDQFNETGRVPERTNGSAAADRNRVRREPAVRELAGERLARNFQFAPVTLGGAGEVQLCPEQRRQQLITGRRLRFITRQNQVDFHAESGPSCSGHSTVIRLGSTDGHQRSGTDTLGITTQEFELASLVATPTEAGQVIPFYPESSAATDDRALLQRGRSRRKGGSVEVLEHDWHARHTCQ